MRWEIRRSLDELLREVGQGPALLSYPYGMVNQDVVRVAREEGCVLGFTCTEGVCRPGESHPLLLGRTPITQTVTPALFPIRVLPWPEFSDGTLWQSRRSPKATAAPLDILPRH